MSESEPAPASIDWSAVPVTGVGSMPGTDVREATRVVAGELPELPHLVELPARGAGADLIGRTLALLPEFAGVTVPTGWRLAARPGADERRALSWLGEDLDTAEELLADLHGPFKVSLAGPLTLAAGVELASGERALRDHGAVRDLTGALAEAARLHVADVRRRLPGATVLVQFDEPSLTAVLEARVPTASGFATLRRIDRPVTEARLREVVEAVVAAGAVPAFHSCAADVDVELLRAVGARALSVDPTVLTTSDALDDAFGECVDAGVAILLGAVPTDGSGGAEPSDVMGTVRRVRQWWHRIGFAPDVLAGAVVLTPGCGLGLRSWPVARDVLGQVREAARILGEDPEGER